MTAKFSADFSGGGECDDTKTIKLRMLCSVRYLFKLLTKYVPRGWSMYLRSRGVPYSYEDP